MTRIVVGVDGSAASINALRWAARYADLVDGQLEAVGSWVMPWTVGEGYAMVSGDWHDETAAAVDAAVATAFGADAPQGRVTRHVVEGHPAQALISAAEGAELLVVGSRGHGGFTGMLLGSVSAHVVGHAPCPVVVVRRPDEPPADAAGEAQPATRL